MATPVHIAVDGWSLVERPWSAEAFHLQEWISSLLGADPALRISVLHPQGSLPSLPAAIGEQAATVPVTAWGRLRYEQRLLPRLAGALGADWLYLPHGAAPLASPVRTAVLLGDRRHDRNRSLLYRMRESLGRAGAGGAARRLRYADLPAVGSARTGVRPVAPIVGDRFRPLADLASTTLDRWGLEPGYVLSCGVSRKQLRPLLAAWTWVEGSMGEAAPLVLTGMDPATSEITRIQAASLGVEHTLRLAPAAGLDELSDLFGGAAAYLHLGAEPAGQTLRWALSCGVPIIGIDQPYSASIVGPAGYLVAAGDARALGAACLTVLVEQPVAADLRQKGLLRAIDWRGSAPLESWLRIFREHLQ